MTILGDLIQESVSDACVELFDGYSVPVTFAGAQGTHNSERKSRVGMIGFTGDGIRGTMAIHVCDALLDQSGADASNRNDWIAELANQLLGRLKNKLLMYDVAIQLSTPVAVEGEGFEMTFKNAQASRFTFDAGEDRSVAVFFDGEYDASMEVQLSEDDSAHGAPEGEMMMF